MLGYGSTKRPTKPSRRLDCLYYYTCYCAWGRMAVKGGFCLRENCKAARFREFEAVVSGVSGLSDTGLNEEAIFL